MDNGLTFFSLAFTIAGVLIYLHYERGKSTNRDARLPYPPGPKGKLIIKNLLDMPPDPQDQWEAATRWCKEYGDIVHLDVMGRHIIFLNSYEAALELLEKRSAIYSDRIQPVMFQLMEVTQFLPFTRYGDEFRLGRRIIHQGFNSTTPALHRDIQAKYARKMLSFMVKEPDLNDEHVKFFGGGIILETIYGFDIQSRHDPRLEIAELGLQTMEGEVAGAHLVDTFPILRHIPEWMPGAEFKRKAKIWKQYAKDSTGIPFRMVSKAFEEGTATPSLSASWLSRISQMPLESEKARYAYASETTLGVAFLAGFETTSSTIMIFLLAMLQYPEVQCKAQQELDEVIGRSRLPDFSDRDHLPFVQALVKEVLRWHPVTPLGIPHCAIADGEYKGMHIPKDSILFANEWGMSRNEAEYGPDVDAFRPERFLNSSARDPQDYAFGFGRRICPGRHLAIDSLFIAISSILHVFRIAKVKNEDGSEKPFEPEWKNTLTSRPIPFPCSLTPRFEGAEKLVD